MVEYGWNMVDNGWIMGGLWWNMVEYGWNMGGYMVVEYGGIWWNMGGIWVEYGG